MFRKKFTIIALALVLALIVIANGPPTDPYGGEVVFDPRKPSEGPVFFGVLNGKPFSTNDPDSLPENFPENPTNENILNSQQ